MAKKKEEATKQEQTSEVVEAKIENAKARWYVVSANSNQEKKTARMIEQTVKANNLDHLVVDVVVPTQEKIVMKNGKKKTLVEVIHKGYVYVKMEPTEEVIHLIRNTEGVRGFLGMTAQSKNPTPLSEKDLNFIEIKKQTTFKTSFEVGDVVKVVSGTWADFRGPIKEVNEAKGQVVVLFSLFGRDTPVTLDFLEVQKL